MNRFRQRNIRNSEETNNRDFNFSTLRSQS